jgi:predicted RNA binding protein YcfA (HicA-like mRNA interferase family)
MKGDHVSLVDDDSQRTVMVPLKTMRHTPTVTMRDRFAANAS